MQREDPVTCMPQDYVMAGRVSVLLRGLGYALKHRCAHACGVVLGGRVCVCVCSVLPVCWWWGRGEGYGSDALLFLSLLTNPVLLINRIHE